MSGRSSAPGDAPGEATTYHVRRARGGDAASLEWIVKRFSPLLRAAADYRLGKTLRALYDPEDLVGEVWAVALPKIGEIGDPNDRITPVLLKFLSTTLLYTVNNLVSKHIRGKPARELGSGDRDPLRETPDRATGIASRIARAETRDLVGDAIARLGPGDREIIILRGIEGHPYKEIAAALRADPKVLAVRYQRALEKLRRELPGSIYDEMETA